MFEVASERGFPLAAVGAGGMGLRTGQASPVLAAHRPWSQRGIERDRRETDRERKKAGCWTVLTPYTQMIPADDNEDVLLPCLSRTREM